VNVRELLLAAAVPREGAAAGASALRERGAWANATWLATRAAGDDAARTLRGTRAWGERPAARVCVAVAGAAQIASRSRAFVGVPDTLARRGWARLNHG
jgi:hypothetical protein